MRTVAEHSPTKDKLLDAAQRLVLSKGFEGTTVDDICKEAKLTKGSFFHYFKSKDTLGLELLKRYCGATKEHFVGCCAGVADPLERLLAVLDYLIRRAKEMGKSGCLLGCMSQELAENHSWAQELSSDAFHRMSSAIAVDLALAKKKYAPKASFHPKELADYWVSLLQGSILISKIKKDPSVAATNLKYLKKHIQILFGKGHR